MSDANYYKKIHTMLSEGKIKDIDTDRKEKAVAAKKEKKEYDSDTDYMLKMAAKGIADVEKKADVKKKASNVKESGADFFRKYADIIKEAEESQYRTAAEQEEFNKLSDLPTEKRTPKVVARMKELYKKSAPKKTK